MIRPEKYQFNWKPKTKSKEDLELVRNLEEIKKCILMYYMDLKN